jgi:hypothetical protein
MIHSSEDLLKEFKRNNLDLTRGMSVEAIKAVVHAPWKRIKTSMANLELIDFRVKYLGSFQVKKGRAKHMVKVLEKKYADGLVEDIPLYIDTIEKLKKYIEDEIENNN